MFRVPSSKFKKSKFADKFTQTLKHSNTQTLNHYDTVSPTKSGLLYKFALQKKGESFGG